MSTFVILKKNIKWRFHNKLTILITILQPLLWLVLYSSVTGQAIQTNEILNYTSFIFPGLIILVIFSTCGSSGIMNYMMKTDGSFYRVLIAPIKRNSIILGQVLEAFLCSLIEVCLLYLIVLLFFSVNLFSNIIGLLIIIILIFLTAFFMASVAYGVSLILPNEMLYETLMNAIVLPIFFLSSALAPINNVNGLLKILINMNPFTHVINSIRCIILEGEILNNEIIFSIILLSIMSIIAFAFASYRLHKESEL